ncbi:FAD binding domain-containing protein [Xylaria bambusicola]|uniref:FAD binding domain-containing protein n=1 Tax=Xylaria bambusicola TaxID=326684 RepID=UPI0020076FBB|nr:FAD binding domain-containing protein [Xylaria bambusicola]KAI0509768.1 FAD binding domain-containing protein [Xylaria bambusicola]
MDPLFGDATIQEKARRDEQSRLDIIIVGGGLGGLGAAIAILLAGHDVTVLEAASDIGEIGAGIQILPNAARILFSWGLKDILEPHATLPRKCNFWGWKGNHLSEMDFHKYAHVTKAPFWDFHRANLLDGLLTRAVQLGAKVITNARVQDFTIGTKKSKESSATVFLSDGRTMTADLVIGADGIHSKLRGIFLGKEDPPIPTGDLAYRLLLSTECMMTDPELRDFVDNPQVNYWLGPSVHAVNYILRGGDLLNMVLLVPDDMPAGKTYTVEGGVREMRDHLEQWDPRLGRLAALCDSQSILKWRLCIRPALEPKWSDSSGAFTMLGDAVHATLPYLASGAGMALEDGGVLGLCLSRLTDKSPCSKRKALEVYEACRRERTEKVVQRGSHNQQVYHLPDGPEQAQRDVKFKIFQELDKEWLSEETPMLPNVQETGDDPFPWRYHGVARWLLTYDMWRDVDEKWAACSAPEFMREPLGHGA